MLPLAGFNRFVQKNQLFTQQSKILAAVSGGIDSVFMATLLHAGGYNMAIAHCNFGLRGNEAHRDEQFCSRLAQDMQAPFYTITFDTLTYAAANKLSVQMAARNLRYQWFEQIRQQNGYDVIALAHHQNDTIETILLNLTRGTGIAGLHGIKPKAGNLVRPLLFTTRQEIALAVNRNHIAYVEDSSNAALKYGRNKIRHGVVPQLKELNPNLEQTFEDHLQHFNELEDMLNMQLAHWREVLFKFDKNKIYLLISGVKNLKPRHLLLYGLLKPYGFNNATIANVIGALGKHPGRRFASTTHNLVVDRAYLIIEPVNNAAGQEVHIDIVGTGAIYNGCKIAVSHAQTPFEINSNPAVAAVDAALLRYPLTLRSWQQGDQFYPLGMQSRKKLSDFFIGQKIPVGLKETIPILVNGNGDIIWVCGYRVDNRYKITPATKKISIFEVTEI